MITKDVLTQNYTSLTLREKIKYFFTIRPFISKENRKFFEGSLILRGQLLKAERKALYDITIEQKPDFCFEIGTYTGGGSTFFIAGALKDNNHGKLITMEINQELFKKTKKRYSMFHPFINKYIIFINDFSPSVFKKYIERQNKNFYFLDGAEDGNQTLSQLNFLTQFISSGDILAFHDWHSEKTSSVKNLMLNDDTYDLVKELGQPESVGLAIFIRK